MSTVATKRLPSLNNSLPDPRLQKRAKLSLNKKRKQKAIASLSAEEVLAHDVSNLLARLQIDKSSSIVPEKYHEVEVEIETLSSSGDGVGVYKSYAYVVPFTLPGDAVLAKPYHVNDTEAFALCDLISVIRKSPKRDDSLVSCRYFGKCSGCQLQMLDYDAQLEHKREVVGNAYKNFSGLDREDIPEIGITIGSPLQYGYRTKITPHFDQPRSGFTEGQYPNIGFIEKGRRRTMDIEECSIATSPLNIGLRAERTRVRNNLQAYKRGATILLRQTANVDQTNGLTSQGYVTDHHTIINELVGRFAFKSPAGAFFQNNNSIMETLTDYVRSKLPSSHNDIEVKYLVDAYCGSGLFTVTCSESLHGVIGVEISEDSVRWARTNAEANGIKNSRFISGKAELIFDTIDFPAAETAVIIDPPRKGCDDLFLNQLLAFSPQRIIYISCNVHTQARDVGIIMSHEKGSCFVLESVRGFDLFPQTYHVESVAVLARRDVGRG